MGLEHFIARRRTVHVGGLRFVCHGPTVATVHLVLGLYGAEIIAARRECDETIDLTELVLASAQALAGLSDWRTRRVLETCVDGDLEAATASTLIRLAETCVGLCDVQRIADSLDIPDEAELAGATAGADEVSPQSVAIVHIARNHGCSPLDVVQWPYEALYEVMEVYEATKPPPNDNGEQDVSSIPGMGVSDSRGW